MKATCAFVTLLFCTFCCSATFSQAATCGFATISVNVTDLDVVVTAEVSTLLPFGERVKKFKVKGLWKNVDTDDTGVFTSPGDNPIIKKKARTYSDVWTLSPGTGSVRIYKVILTVRKSEKLCKGILRGAFRFEVETGASYVSSEMLRLETNRLN